VSNKTYWTVVTAVVTIGLAGAAYLASGNVGFGVPLIVICFLLLAWLIANHLAVQRWIRWADRVADFGTSEIQNAPVGSDDDVKQLEVLYDKWDQRLQEGVSRYCLQTDAKSLEYLDSFDGRGFSGFNKRHKLIREWTAEKVSRLRTLSRRLERGETHLRRLRVPRH